MSLRLIVCLRRAALLLLCLPPCVAFGPAAAAQIHTTDAQGVLEGPQTPGTPPPPKPAAAAGQMSNDTVLRMHAAGLTDALIIQTIAAQPGEYKTGPDDLISLKSAGISDEVLSAMVNKPRRPMLTASAPPTPTSVAPQIDEIGVYYKDAQGQWQPMESEAVHTKTSGFLKSTLSRGIIKQDDNGLVNGPEAALVLHRPQEFLIYTPDGRDAGDYTLVLFHLNGKDREFRVLTGGVFHSQSGARQDEVPFKATRIAPHTYTFTLTRENAGGGEYGILPPGTGNITNGGKIYTFAIVE